MEKNVEFLYRLYAKELYSFIFSISKNHNLSEDILQITFLEAIKSIHNFKEASSIKTWLFSIAKYQCFHLLKKNINHLSLQDIDQEYLGSTREDIISGLYFKEIIKVIDVLKEPDRTIVILRILSEYSFSEIGKLLGKSENYCRVNYYRAKNKLREELRGYV
ncbi:MAG TPA: RNA polymerase sigma factor [Clostridiaceae bacterium]